LCSSHLLPSTGLLARNEALRVAASLHAATLDSTCDGILVVVRQGKITTCNRLFLEMWRIYDALAGTRDDATILAAVLDQLADPQAFAAGVERLYADPAAESADMLAFKDGRVFERVSRPQRLNGVSIGRVWSFRDVTHRHRMEADLRTSEARARGLIENISDVITITDPHGGYKFVSPSVKRILGYDPLEFEGRNVLDFIHAEDAQGIAASLDRLGRTGTPSRTEFRYRHKDGSWRTLESMRLDARGTPGIEGFLGVARDVTETRQLEAEARSRRELTWRQERLSALGTLVAGVAHEINNPLTYIIGNLEMAELAIGDLPASSAKDDLERHVQVALTGSQQISRITKALKTVSRQESATSHRMVDLVALARDVTELTRAGTPAHVEVGVVERAEAVRVMGDPSQLLQVVLNLAKNAAEALGANPGSVTIAVERADTHAELRVVDNGPGIDAAVQARLFTPFFTTKSEGTGLGLSIVHSIVKAHGGDVHLESAPGRGTTVLVRLPLAA
jgi:PAS domain S-box-containing protein